MRPAAAAAVDHRTDDHHSSLRYDLATESARPPPFQLSAAQRNSCPFVVFPHTECERASQGKAICRDLRYENLRAVRLDVTTNRSQPVHLVARVQHAARSNHRAQKIPSCCLCTDADLGDLGNTKKLRKQMEFPILYLVLSYDPNFMHGRTNQK